MAPLKGFSPMPHEKPLVIVNFSTTPADPNHDGIRATPLTIQIATENTRVVELEMYTSIGK